MINGRVTLSLPDSTHPWTAPLMPPLVVTTESTPKSSLLSEEFSNVHQFNESSVVDWTPMPAALYSSPNSVRYGSPDLSTAIFPAISETPTTPLSPTTSNSASSFVRGFNWMTGNLSKMEMLFINNTLSLGLATLFRAAPDVLALGVAATSPELAQAVFANTDPSFDWLTLANLATKWQNYMEASIAISFIFNGRSALKNSFLLKAVDRGFLNKKWISNWPHKTFQFFYDQKELTPTELMTHSYLDVLAKNGVMGAIRKIGLTMGNGIRGKALMTSADFTFNTIISWGLAYIFESNFDPVGMLARSSLATGLQVAANSILGANPKFSDSEVMLHRTVFGVEKAGFYTGLSNSQSLPDWAKWSAQLVYGALAIYQAKKAVQHKEENSPQKST